VAVVRFPGSNCEYETARALASVGLEGEIVPSRAARGLSKAHAVVLPGGFAYEDRVRAGAIAAHEPIIESIRAAARDGMPILGICNGAQILVESGLVPGEPPGRVRMALAANRLPGRAGYYTRWSFLRITDTRSVFTSGLEPGTVVPVPMAHAEGRFATADASLRTEIESGRRVVLRYVRADGEDAAGFPENPNGSIGDAAAVAGGDGNVLAMMPHPERANWIWQVPPALPGVWGTRRREWTRTDTAGSVAMSAAGPGRVFFAALARHLGVAPC
jgi:phosphoribosylformylglycinamidine synthase